MKIRTLYTVIAVMLAVGIGFVGCEQGTSGLTDVSANESDLNTLKIDAPSELIGADNGVATYQTSVTYPGAQGVNYEYNVTTTVTWSGNTTTFHYSVYATGGSSQDISHIFMHGVDGCFADESGRPLVKEGNGACNADVNGQYGFKWDNWSGKTWEWTVTLPHAYAVEENVGLYVKTATNCEVMWVPGPVCGEYLGISGNIEELACDADQTVSYTNWNVTISQGSDSHSTVTDGNGDYSFSDVGGVWTVVATGYGKTINLGTVEVGPESQVANHYQDTRPNGSCAWVTGNVQETDCDIHANNTYNVAGATVTLEGTSYSTTTDGNGNYTLMNIPVGSYTVVVTYPTGGTVTGTINVTDESGTYTVSTIHRDVRPNLSCAAIVGTVTEEVCIDQTITVVPVAGAQVTLSSGQSVTTDENGNFEFSNMTPGDYTVTVAGYTVDGAASITVSVSQDEGTYSAGTFFRVYTAEICGGTNPNECSLSMGYWFAKPQSVWPAGGVTIGGHTYTQAEGKAIWDSSNKGGMPGAKLAFLQIAAIKLSQVVDNDNTSDVWQLVSDAEAILATYNKLSPSYLPKDRNLSLLGGQIGNWIDSNHCLESN